MSMLGISFLNDIVRKESVTKASEVLDELRNKVIDSLKQKGIEGEQKDGMDMAIISINHKTNIVQYAGANNPLYVVKNEKPKIESKYVKFYEHSTCNFKLFEVKPDKMPIAIYEKMDKFTNHEFELEKGDKLYMFTDGYADQFGGEKGKKYKYKPFKELLLVNAHLPMDEQKQVLDNTYNNWKGNIDQVDDILIIGIEV